MFYGGSAGCGKSFLLLLVASTNHQKSIIFRREYPQLKGIEDESLALFAGRGTYNRSEKIWRFYDGRQIEFGAVQLDKDKEKYQGRAHSLKCYDEITHFTKSQYTFLIGWTRTTNPGERTRVICTGNPPTSAEGDWVIDYWGPWLDERHLNPAKPGELRWYTNLDGQQIEVPDGTPFMHKGVLTTPKSRTFIPGTVYDNPYLLNTGYVANLQALPEELREKYLEGKFSSSREDYPMQVIPSAWVVAAQERWKQRVKPHLQCSKIGVDVARGGKDRTVFTKLYGNWFAPQIVHKGTTTPDGNLVVSLLIPELEFQTKVNVDVIGVGSSVYDQLRVNRIIAYAVNSAEKSEALDRSRQLSFYNKRAEMWWKFREALDPETGIELAIPEDRELLADLTATRWQMTPRGIQVEPKDKIIERIGRSPDKADSMIYALVEEQPFAYGTF